MDSHLEKVSRIQKELEKAFKQKSQVSFLRKTTNSTRNKVGQKTHPVDISDLDQILCLNTEKLVITVEPDVSMDVLVAYTLEHNLIPAVVPEFPGITVGGAVQGGALESSSFKFGQFNDSCISFEVLLVDGTLVVATLDNESADLFWGMSTSYGTLGLLTQVSLKLVPAQAFVDLTIKTYPDYQTCIDAILKETRTNVDFVESILLGQSKAVSIVGKLSKQPSYKVQRFSRNIDPWYWRFVRDATVDKEKVRISVPVTDYLFRQDKGAFWMGEYLFPIFSLPSTRFTRFLFAPFMRTRKLYDGLHALRMQQEFVIQDIFMDIEDIDTVLQCNQEQLEIYPIWLCPIKASTEQQKLSSHFRERQQMLLNVGIYGLSKYENAVSATKRLEQFVAGTRTGRKMLYSQTFYTKDELWAQYDKTFFDTLRTKYRANDLKSWDEKLLVNQDGIRPQKWKGIWQMLLETLAGKNVVWW